MEECAELSGPWALAPVWDTILTVMTRITLFVGAQFLTFSSERGHIPHGSEGVVNLLLRGGMRDVHIADILSHRCASE